MFDKLQLSRCLVSFEFVKMKINLCAKLLTPVKYGGFTILCVEKLQLTLTVPNKNHWLPE